MSTLEILRGVPASGKSTYAVINRDDRGAAVVCRDDIRMAMFGRYSGVDERVITDVENAAIESALRNGQDVILDATNLRNKYLTTKLSLASRYGATVKYRDFPVPLLTALQRDSGRGHKKVGPRVIESFFKRYKIDREVGALPTPPAPLPEFERHVPDESKPAAYVVDTDGTLANHQPHRSPYDTTRYHLDTVIEHVAGIVRGLSGSFNIIGLSGRDETFRGATEYWWDANDIPFHEFLMRPEGDKRMDAIVKYELFKQYVEPNYNVLGAIDDRPQVIRMWETIGVPVINVGSGREF